MAFGRKPQPHFIIRVDDRLLHGQVIVGWGMGWPADEIWLVSDRIAGNPVEKKLYETLLPEAMRGGVMACDEAIIHWQNIPQNNRKILLVVESVRDLQCLSTTGLRPDASHVGCSAPAPGKSRISPAVFLSQTDLDILKALAESGLETSIQDVPSSKPIPIKEIKIR